MPIDAAEVAKLKEDYEKAQAALDKEDAERFRILRTHMGEEPYSRLVDRLNEKLEAKEQRILFGLAVPEEAQSEPEPAKAKGSTTRGKRTTECPVCHRKYASDERLRVHLDKAHPGHARQSGTPPAGAAATE